MSLELNNKIKINTYKNAIFQAVSIALSFYLYPLLVGYLEPLSLGVWFTILSITSWFMILDIGLSHGLRNKLSELIVKKKIYLSKTYLSSTYYYFGFFLFLLLLLIGIILWFIDVSFIFNIEKGAIADLNLVVFIVFSTVILNLFFTINFSLSNAMQNASFTNFRNMLFNIQMILILSILMYMKKGTLLDMAVVFMLSNMLVNAFTTYILYKKYDIFLPSFKLVSYKYFSNNLKLGLDFFIINISSLIMFSTDSILIAQLIGVEHVTQYTIIIKVFSAFVMLQSFYIGPLWSAYSEKYYHKDFPWINNTLMKSILVTFVIYIFIGLSILLFSNILMIWFGNSDYYNEPLIIAIAIYIMVRLWSSNFSTILNGLSITVFQKYTSIIATIINLPLSIYLVKYTSLGIAGIAYGSAISLGIFALIAPFYTYRILKREFV